MAKRTMWHLCSKVPCCEVESVSHKKVLIHVQVAGHAVKGEDDRDSADSSQLAAEGSDSAASSSDEASDMPSTALPRPLPETEAEVPPEAGGPSAAGGAEEASTSGRLAADGVPVALSPGLITLALLPRSQWQGLVHLDAIKVRKSAPITMHGLKGAGW